MRDKPGHSIEDEKLIDLELEQVLYEAREFIIQLLARYKFPLDTLLRQHGEVRLSQECPMIGVEEPTGFSLTISRLGQAKKRPRKVSILGDA